MIEEVFMGRGNKQVEADIVDKIILAYMKDRELRESDGAVVEKDRLMGYLSAGNLEVKIKKK